MPNPYRGLPSVDALLQHERVAALTARLPDERLTQHVRDVLAQARAQIQSSNGDGAASETPVDGARLTAELATEVVASVERASRPSLVAAINATGVIIHTNLGRAPLSEAARAAMETVSREYSNLEFDLEAGGRGSRLDHLQELLKALTGVEAGIAVNNNASALLLSLSALAQGREVIISRGQAVEIGGGFRIPDVMLQSGAQLVEVGTTNRTRASDYGNAVSDKTAAILRVHSSNFRIVGFTEEPSLRELRTVADEHGVLLLDDLGSGCLLDTTSYGLAAEPTPQESVAAGVDLMMFSGDKLLGGPQAGIAAGRADLVDVLKRHPLARALRCDKATIAALSATLTHYFVGEAESMLPVWRMISTAPDEIREWAQALLDGIGRGQVEESESMVGGGSLPGESLPTFVLALHAADLPDGMTPAWLAERLRTGSPPVVVRVSDDAVLLDPRTIASESMGDVVERVVASLTG